MKDTMGMRLGYGSRDVDQGSSMSEDRAHARLTEIHSSKDAFVKRSQEETAKYAGREPKLREENMRLNAYMNISGEHAKEFGRKLTEGLDKVAYPVK